jgi:hypothetical protein
MVIGPGLIDQGVSLRHEYPFEQTPRVDLHQPKTHGNNRIRRRGGCMKPTVLVRVVAALLGNFLPLTTYAGQSRLKYPKSLGRR